MHLVGSYRSFTFAIDADGSSERIETAYVEWARAKGHVHCRFCFCFLFFLFMCIENIEGPEQVEEREKKRE